REHSPPGPATRGARHDASSSTRGAGRADDRVARPPDLPDVSCAAGLVGDTRTADCALRVQPSRFRWRPLRRRGGARLQASNSGTGIGDCACNPHATQGALFRDAETRDHSHAIAKLASAGLRVTGPVAADTAFARAVAGEFDAVIAPYPDVGMAPFQTISFGSG